MTEAAQKKGFCSPILCKAEKDAARALSVPLALLALASAVLFAVLLEHAPHGRFQQIVRRQHLALSQALPVDFGIVEPRGKVNVNVHPGIEPGTSD
jgi:hypothetical protein